MKIMEVIPSFEPLGGAENFVFNLAIALKNDAEIFVVSLYNRTNEYINGVLEKKGINIIYLDKKKGFDFSCSKHFYNEVKRIKPDVIHLHLNSYVTCLSAIIAKKSRFIFTFHTVITRSTYGKKRSLRNLLIKFLMKHGYMFPITISDTVDESFQSFFGALERKIIYNGIDVSRFSYNRNSKKKYTFISVGSFNDIKNNLFMIQCVEKLINDGYNVNYVVLGTGKNYKCCYDYCLQHNLMDRVIMPGVVNNVEEYFAQSRCLLLASHWEGNPLVINEAIASGVWVVANCVGGVRDLIDDSNGYLVIPENEKDFLDKMKDYISNEKQISNKIIPNNIERNRKKVDLFNSSSEYYQTMCRMIK